MSSGRGGPRRRLTRSRAAPSLRFERLPRRTANMASERCGPDRPRRSGNRFPPRSSPASSRPTRWRSSMPKGRGAGRMEIVAVAVPVLTDNYAWLIHNAESGETAVVDPSVADPVLEAAAARGWRLTQVLNTHWHPDHTGGNQGIQAATNCTIIAPAEAKRVSNVDRIVGEGDRVAVAGREAVVWDIPAHTAGHIAYYFEGEGMIFVGDTMFAMGCGRLFEGTAQQMYRSLRRIAALPEQVRIYCGHEYTLANARF